MAALYVALLEGRRRAARLLALAPVATVAVLAALEFAQVPQLLRATFWIFLVLDALTVVAIGAFDRHAPPVRRRWPWLVG